MDILYKKEVILRKGFYSDSCNIFLFVRPLRLLRQDLGQ